MKIAIVGKGGTGKTTIAGTLARLLARDGYNVIAVDADPNLNLASSLGIPSDIASKVRPLSENIELIKKRTVTSYGFINYTPKVDDIVDKYGIVGPDGVKLLVMGTVRKGGGGCMCPENAFLRALLAHLILGRKDVVILDMVAGIEHLGRGTARGVDLMICVVEPSVKSIQTAFRIKRLAGEIGVRNVVAVANKVRGEDDIKFIENELSRDNIQLIGVIPYDDVVIEADRLGKSLLDYAPDSKVLLKIIELKEKIIRNYWVQF